MRTLHTSLGQGHGLVYQWPDRPRLDGRRLDALMLKQLRHHCLEQRQPMARLPSQVALMCDPVFHPRMRTSRRICDYSIRLVVGGVSCVHVVSRPMTAFGMRKGRRFLELQSIITAWPL